MNLLACSTTALQLLAHLLALINSLSMAIIHLSFLQPMSAQSIPSHHGL